MQMFEKKQFAKGQIISKGLFGILNSPKKQTSQKTNKQIQLYYCDTHVDLFSFVFWEKLNTPKKHFEIN